MDRENVGQVDCKGENPDTMDHGQGTWDRLLAREGTQTQWIMAWTGDVGQVACKGGNPDTMDHGQGTWDRLLARERTQ